MKRKYLFKSRKKLQQLSCVHNTRHKLFWKSITITQTGVLRYDVKSQYLLTKGITLSWKQQLKLWKGRK